ncbi:hypothetical protein AGMMS49938_16600 [Fibrobacterales bacterium]|nr:hypothetical protein AGMMS49938_16600 [Fibrobacterales bacterium]
MPNCTVYAPVFASDSHGEFVWQLKKAMTVKDDPAFTRQAKEIALQNDWADKAEQVVELIKQ